MTSSGANPAALRESPCDAGFLAGVLDFLSSDERSLVEFCAGAEIAPSAAE